MAMNGDVRLLLGALVLLGGVGIVAAILTGHDAYVSGIAAVVCLLNGVVLTYVNRVESGEN
jgi:hypothetical protein